MFMPVKSKLQRAILVLFFMIAGIALTGFAYEIRTAHTAFHGIKKIEIIPGLGSRKIGELLKHEGLIRSKWAFVIYVSIRREASYLKPGIYAFNDTATIPDIARDLTSGAAELSITIPEGWTSTEIAAYLDKQGIASRKDFQNAIGFDTPSATLQSQFAFLKEKPAYAGLEGYLFPDTYRFFIHTPTEQIVAKMLQNFDAKLSNDLRQEALHQNRTIFEIITMASLIEKEVASENDRALVSGVLWKRLELNIPLHVDATVLYARPQRIGKVSLADTKINSPYNTYRYAGLPPGPIANPGLSAIRATLFPKKSPYFYYLSTPDGKTIFSKTLEDHNRAKSKYLK
jgi:UPF0755 protein